MFLFIIIFPLTFQIPSIFTSTAHIPFLALNNWLLPQSQSVSACQLVNERLINRPSLAGRSPSQMRMSSFSIINSLTIIFDTNDNYNNNILSRKLS